MKKQVRAEYEINFNCPQCERLTTLTGEKIESGHITKNGNHLDVTCDDCNEEYTVILQP